MAELFDTRRVRDDDAHWDALAERVARQAARRSSEGGVVSLAASRAGVIAASLLFAVSLLYMTMSRGEGARSSPVLGQALAPSDDVGRVIALTGRPPALGALLFDARREGGP